MKNQFYTKFLLFVAIFTAFFQANTNAQLLKVSGQKIVNSTNNQEVVLNAINFGNWMVMEGYMMNSNNQAPSQHIWKQKLTTLLGAEKTKQFYDAWLTNHVTQADINQVKAWGFNSVRLPLHYEYFVNLGTPDVWNEQGFTILDNVVAWCKAAGIYAIIDLHAAPGGQSDNAISDYDNTKPALWGSAANKNKTVKLWRKISERYKNEEYVGGYDLINEPAWTLPNGTELREIYGRLTDTIRANNDNHILFIEGNWYANDYTGLTPAWDANMVYVFHKYWSNTTDGDIKWVTDLRTAQNRPIWCGEHGENSNDNFTKLTELFKRNNIGMSWWPMKKFESFNDFADAKWSAGYMDVLNYMGGSNPSLNPTTAFNTLMQLAENVKLENTKLQTEVVRAIITQPTNRKTEPYETNNIPGRIYAPDYDMGMNGYAYSDQTSEDIRLSTGTAYVAWNDGWVYRNNGVDVEACTDAQSNGYNVGWFNADEWMQYTVNVASAGTYTIELRVASGNSSSGTVQIQNAAGTEILATATVPATGGWKSWTTINCTGGFAATGVQSIRIVNTSGGFNLASVNFVYVNSTIPTFTQIPAVAKVISLKGNNGMYVTIKGTNNLMTCTSATIGATEEFTLVDAGDGLYALKGINGMYVTLNTDDKLYCNSTTIGNNQKFTLDNINGLYTIRGNNNKYVSSENGSAAGLNCTRLSPGGWEYFGWSVVKNPSKPVAVTGIALLPTTATIETGATQQLTATISPSDASNKAVTYTSSNTAVATVSSTGLITGVTTGTATITATSQDGSKTATCAVTVTFPTGYSQVTLPSETIKVFPNPAQNTLTISSLTEEKLSVIIYDIRGTQIISTFTKGKSLSMDISEIPSGVYFIKVFGMNKTETHKFIKE